MSFKRNFKKGNGATAGAFKTRTKGLYTARFNGKYLKSLVAVVKDAMKQSEPGIVFFIRKNENPEENHPIFRIGAAVDKPRKKGRAIDHDEDEQDEDVEDEDSSDESGSDDADGDDDEEFD